MLRALAAWQAVSAGYGSAGSQVSIAMLKSMGKLDVVEVLLQGHSADRHRCPGRHAVVHLSSTCPTRCRR